MDVIRSLGMVVVFGAAVACSQGDTPASRATPATPKKEVKATPAAPKAAETPVVAPPVEDCIEPVAAEAISSVVRTWELVGTSRERVFLGGVGEVVFVSAGGRLYDAAAGEALAASSRNAVGLPHKPMVSVFGTWPGDAWLVTAKSTAPAVPPATQEFDLWRWQAERWTKQNKKPLPGETTAEVYKWTEGRVIGLNCSARPRLSFESFGAEGPLPPKVSRVGNSSLCPERFFALPSGDVYALDDLSRANHLMIHWCPSCGDPAVEEILPLRLCGAPPTVSMGDIQVPVAPREPILSLHARTRGPDGAIGFSGAFVARRGDGGWVGEAVPGGKSVDTMAVGTDGAIWLATDILLRRDPKGKWERHGLPPEVTGNIAQVAVAREDEVWLVVEEPAKEGAKTTAPTWALYRTGSAQKGVTLKLDR